MDYRFSFQRPMRTHSFGSMKGTIVGSGSGGQGGRHSGCLLFVIEDTGMKHVNFFSQPG